MAKAIKSILILITCVLLFIPNGYSAMVRVVYFVPADRTPNWNIPVALDSTMKTVQRFYTEQMQSHGYNKSFALEKDKGDTVVVHYVAGK